jgi:AcrR family transcriptional regulator
MLAEDPSASITAIATAAGVDRRTVYRRFAGRDELLAAVYQARLTGIEEAIRGARFAEAPVPVALHSYVEAIVGVNRRWPVELSRMRSDPVVRERRTRAVATVDAFLRRAADEGFLRPGPTAGWAGSVLGRLVHLTASEMRELSAAQAADLLVDTFLHGFGST